MSIFGDLGTEGHEEKEDRLGGYKPKETDIYTAPIKLAYAGQSDGGARNITLVLDIDGQDYTETVYITSKEGKNYYEKNGNKISLPGFVVIDDLCMVTAGTPLKEQETEEKVVKVWDSKEKKELNKSVQVLKDVMGQTASFAIQKVLENVNEKDGNGKYVPTDKTRESNNIQKVFHTETRKTVPEALKNLDTPEYWDAWLERNKGETYDKREKKGGANAGAPGASDGPPQGGTGERKSLFGNDS